MTLPDERYRAVVETGKFLQELLSLKGVPKEVKESARWCLRHYPTELDMQYAARDVPRIFAEKMEDVHRMMAVYEQGKNNET